jgi:hypothetical protein
MQRIVVSVRGVFFSFAGHVRRRGGKVNFASRPMEFAIRHLSTGGTYYDSQSGQHVSIHDERKITAYLRSSIDDDEIARGGDALLASMDAAKALGAAGSVLTLPQKLRRDGGTGGNELRLLEALGNITKPTPADEHDCALFIRIPMSYQFSLTQLLHTPAHVNLCFEYKREVTSFNSLFANGIRTSIGIFHPKYYIDVDPISLASEVANLIDKTASEGSPGSISYIVLDPTSVQHSADTESHTIWDDELVRVCEELSYLDVIGPTIKSRLVVPAHNPDHIEECLGIGISKFIVDDAECLEILGNVVEEAGKELVLNVMK